jgi:hypothetical protein
VDEGFELGRQMWAGILPYAGRAQQHLGPLFEIELQYRPGMSPVTSSEGAIGEYLGSGDGTAKGPTIRGAVCWDLFEEQGETLCRSSLRGVIEMDDGAQIPFDTSARPRKRSTRFHSVCPCLTKMKRVMAALC